MRTAWTFAITAIAVFDDELRGPLLRADAPAPAVPLGPVLGREHRGHC